MPTIPSRTISQEKFDKVKEMSGGLEGQELLDWVWRNTKDKFTDLWRLYNKAKFRNGETVTHVELDLDN